MAKKTAYVMFVNAIASAQKAFVRGESLMLKAAAIAKADNQLSAIFAKGRTPKELQAMEQRLKAAVAKAYGWDADKIGTNWRVFKLRIRKLMADPRAVADQAKAERKVSKTKRDTKGKPADAGKPAKRKPAPKSEMEKRIEEATKCLYAIETALNELASAYPEHEADIQDIVRKVIATRFILNKA